MASDNGRHEIVVHFDDSGESIVLNEAGDDPAPGAHPGEARVEVDPLVEAFARSPYDPIIGAMMMGRATGEVIAHPPRIGWMRVIAYLLAIGLIGQLVAMLYLAFESGRFGLGASLPSLLLTVLLAFGGVLLLRRLGRG
jgi:hypothetical protein